MTAPLDIPALRRAIALELGLAPDHPCRSPIDRDIKRLRFVEAIWGNDAILLRSVQGRQVKP